MASSYTLDKLFANAKLTAYSVDGDYTTAADIDQWVDMRDHETFAVLVIGMNLTGAGPDSLDIIANTASDGSGTDRIVDSWSGSAPTAEGDYIMLEVSAEQIRQVGEDNSEDLRYVSVKLGLANAADEAAVVYIRRGGRFSYDGQSADSVT